MNNEKKWNVPKERIQDKKLSKVYDAYKMAETQMLQRTNRHELYGLIAKNKSIHEWTIRKGSSKYFSEGSTQYIIRKTLSDTIQRVPDGELTTQWDKGSWQHIVTQYLFENKVMWSEFKGIDMMSNLTKAYKMSFIYCFAPVRTSYEKDYDDDMRIQFNLEQWSDVFPDRDCKDIRSANVIFFRQYMSRDEVEALIDEEGNVYDSTYNADTIKYVIENDEFGAKYWQSEKLGDKLKGSSSVNSLQLITEYRRGADEFVTFVPGLNAEFRRVPNYDPRKEIPWTFLVLEPDSDFPLGISQVEFLLGDQQFNDLFQTSAYKNLLLAMEPPIMVSGWETNPSSYRFEPRKIWNLGNNPNQAKVEPVKIDNAVLSGWAKTRESVAASMLRNLNVSDGTIAKDAGAGFSKTAPGVDEQKSAKTININQYQKRVEFFIDEWATMALRSYINAMGGEHWLTVDEKTRRLLEDIGRDDLIEGNKILVDFDELSSDLIKFKVRTGSLVQRREDKERNSLLEMLQTVMQNLNGLSEQNRPTIENEVVLPALRRILELSDTDISQSTGNSIAAHEMELEMQQMRQDLDIQRQAILDQDQRIASMEAGEAQPHAEENIPDMQGDGGEMPSSPIPPAPETPGQQVNNYANLLEL